MFSLSDYENISFFNGVDFRLISGFSSVKYFAKDELFSYECDSSLDIHFLLSGSIKSFKNSRNSEIFLFSLSAGDCMSDLLSLESDSIVSKSSLICTSDSVVLSVNFEKLKKILSDKQKLKFFDIAALKNEKLNYCLDTNLVYDSIARVSQLLDINIYLFNNSKSLEIAYILNLTPETLSRTIKVLSNKKAIEKVENKIIVLNDDILKSFYL